MFQLLILESEGTTALSPHLSRISVSDCPNVLVTNSSINHISSLQSLDLANISNLTLSHESFKLSSQAKNVLISIRNASIDVLPRFVFHGDVETIVLENAAIRQIQAFAFANIVNTIRITLDNCAIESIESLAFKKFEVKYLHVKGGSFGNQVPSRIMNNVEVSDKFMLDGVRMGVVRSSAFVVRRPKTVAIVNCDIDELEGEAFDLTARGTVIIKDNRIGHVAFGAFLSIHVDAENRNQNPITPLYSLMFTNNSLTSFQEGSLVFDRDSFKPELSSVLVNQVCDCGQIATWKSQILNQSVAYSRLYSRNNEVGSTGPKTPITEDPESFLCLEDRDGDSAVSLVDYEAKKCTLGNSVLLVSLVTTGAILGAILLAVLAFLCYRSRRGRGAQEGHWISVPTSAPDVVTAKKNGVIGGKDGTNTVGGTVDSRITMVVPDGRLYRETEFHVIVEKAEPLTTEL